MESEDNRKVTAAELLKAIHSLPETAPPNLDREQMRRFIWLLDRQPLIESVINLFRSSDDVRRFQEYLLSRELRERNFGAISRHAKTVGWLVATAAALTAFRTVITDWIKGLANLLNFITGG